MPILLTCFLLLVSLPGYSIRVLDRKGNSVTVQNITSRQYTEAIIQSKLAMDTQVVEKLSPSALEGKSWKLKKFSLGVGTSGEVGIGPFKVGKSFRQRFNYSRSR